VAEVFEPCLGVLARHQIYGIRTRYVDDHQVKRRGLRTDFVEYKDETLSLRFAPAYLLFHQPATTPSRVARIEDEDDNVGLVDDFV